jgi:hypothetical protein
VILVEVKKVSPLLGSNVTIGKIQQLTEQNQKQKQGNE